MQTFFRPAVIAQPSTLLEINWNHPITNGLLFSTYNSAIDYAIGPWDYVTRTGPRQNAAVSAITSSTRGVAPLFDGSTSAAVAAPKIAGTNRFTMSFWLWWNAYSNGSGKLAFKYSPDSGSQADGEFIIGPDDSSGNFAFVVTSGASNQAAYKITRPSAAAWHFIDWTVDLAKSTLPVTDVRVDGVSFGNSGGLSTYGGPRLLLNYSMSVMCSPPGTPSVFSAGRVANVNIWGRILSVDERMSMYRNAFQVLRNPMMVVGLPSTATVATSTNHWFLMQ